MLLRRPDPMVCSVRRARPVPTVEVSSSLEGAAIRRRGGAPLCWPALALLAASAACGGPNANTDPLAPIAEAVAEEDRSPPPLTEVWSRSAGAPLTLRPAVGERHVYLALGSVLEAWRIDDGALVWRHELDSTIAAPPAAIGQQVVVGTRGGDAFPARVVWISNEGNIVSLRDVDEAILTLEAAPGIVVVTDSSTVARVAGDGWRVDVETPRHITLSPSHSLVFVTAAGGQLLALDLRSGDRRWTHTAADTELTRAVVHDDTLYVAGTSGHVAALDATSGEVRWARTLGSIDVLGAPAVAGDVLWLAGLDARLIGLKASNGTLLYTPLELPSRNYLDIAAFDVWAVLGPQYGPWTSVRGPTDAEGHTRPPTRVAATAPPAGQDLELPAATGAAGVAVVNGIDTVMFLQPRRPRLR